MNKKRLGDCTLDELKNMCEKSVKVATGLCHGCPLHNDATCIMIFNERIPKCFDEKTLNKEIEIGGKNV